MSFGFDNVKPGSDRVYLREAGIHENAKFLGLTYDATEQYEFFDIAIETADGKYFRERTFGPNKEKIFPKDKYVVGKKVGTETKEEAYERVKQEINTKLFYLASCFCSKEVLNEKVSKAKSLKEFIEAINKAIGEPINTVNFLTIWKNSDIKQKSNLIIAERIKWIEKHTEGKKSSIQLSKWQIEHNLVEKYPFGANTEDGEPTETLIGTEQGHPAQEANDLPF